MSVMHRRRSRLGLTDPLAESAPEPGMALQRPIPDTVEGIRFEIGRMVKYVRDFRAHPDVVTLARRIVQLCAAKDKMCEMGALFHWTKNHVRYVNDPVDGEAIATPIRQIAEILTPPEVIETVLGPELIKRVQGFGIGGALLSAPNQIKCPPCFCGQAPNIKPVTSGDCDEGATFLGTMLAAIGIEPRFRFGGVLLADDKPDYQHVWVQGLEGEKNWVDMDVTESLSELGWFYPDFPVYGHVHIFR